MGLQLAHLNRQMQFHLAFPLAARMGRATQRELTSNIVIGCRRHTEINTCRGTTICKELLYRIKYSID